MNRRQEKWRDILFAAVFAISATALITFLHLKIKATEDAEEARITAAHSRPVVYSTPVEIQKPKVKKLKLSEIYKPVALYSRPPLLAMHVSPAGQREITEACRKAHKGCGTFLTGCYENLTVLMTRCETDWIGQCADYQPMTKRERIEHCLSLITER